MLDAYILYNLKKNRVETHTKISPRPLNACFSSFFRSEIVEQFHEIFGEWPAPKIVVVIKTRSMFKCMLGIVCTYLNETKYY